MKNKITEIFTKYTSTDAKHVLELHGNVYVIDPMDHHKIIEEIDQFYLATDGAKERYEKALSYYENETYMNGETLNAVKQALLIASGYLFKK